MFHEGIAFTRREFLYSGMAMISTATSAPAFLARSGLAMADQNMAHGLDRSGSVPEQVLVVVQLSGGNDGLNTVIPVGSPGYYRARPRIAIAEKDALLIDPNQGIALHPALADLHEMVSEGLASVVQGVGYPNPNRSHFASMDVWHTGDTRGGRGHGWIGKGLDQDRNIDRSLACVCIGSDAPLAAQGRHVKPVAFERAEAFRWAGRQRQSELASVYDRICREGGDSDMDAATRFVYRTALDAQVASDRVRKAVATGPVTRFAGGALSRQLQLVAAMIRAELPTRVYYVALGGFDTHAQQVFTHQRLLREFASAMKTFYRELEATGHRSRVVTLAFSEFGRRVAQNASAGTDHGAAGPVFLFGDVVRPGLQGEHPPLDQLVGGDLRFGLDFRCIYAELLDNWLQLDSTAALGRVFRKTRLLDLS